MGASSTSSPSSTLHKRPPTPKSSSPPQSSSRPPVPENTKVKDKESHPPRRSSLGFLRRSRSGDPVRKTSPSPIVAPSPPKLPEYPLAPSRNGFVSDIRDSVAIFSGHAMSSFTESPPSSEDARSPSNGPGGYIPGRKSTDSVVGVSGGTRYLKSSSVPLTDDPYAKEGSMAHRGRYSYASSAANSVNSPRRVRRRRDPTPFNILVIGAKNSGKSSFLRFLRQSLALKPKRGHVAPAEELPEAPEEDTTTHSDTSTSSSRNAFKSSYLETEIDGERIGLTLWDSEGLEKGVVDLQLRETVAFLESKFEDTFNEETKVVRAPGAKDTHVHCVFLLLDPARLTPGNHYYNKKGDKPDQAGLDDDLDIAVLRALHGKTTVVPVISKADNCTSCHMEELKKIVRQGLERAGIDPLEALELELAEGEEEEEVQGTKAQRGSLVEADEEYSSSGEDAPQSSDKSTASSVSTSRKARGLNSFLPLSVISPDGYEPGERVGRHFPWGFADPYNEAHCDFVRLKEAVFGDWRADLREKSRDVWYENWRSDRLGARRGR
ncbi:unnamed protein product [Tuber melanosporum]|uniref:(Perigord truffle) hypothetical protein n=1 Tax=Tuber melanosporum (strain Mel28) TaxID=656061 RepID=D5GI02_TUBMM|nr:uncharacterized protein GSTUM_00008214001 [Tuber melanosporum]CAZ84145.1 unnamed protein product [Tuber melanosporum]